MPSDADDAKNGLRDRLIGLGERSMAKSYYPELRRRLDDLERFRAVIDHANDAIFVFLAEDWTVADVNETALMLLGLARGEVLGRHISAFFPPEIAGRYASALKEEGPLQLRNGHIVTVLSGAGGRRVPTEITVTLHRFADVGYAVVVARDVTMRQQMEAELDKSRKLFASFMENSPALCTIKDTAGRYLFCNPAFAQWLGKAPREIIGLTDAEVWSDDVLAMIRETDGYVLREGRPLMLHEEVRPRAGGPLLHIQLAKFPLRQGGGFTALGMVGVDITKQVETEQALQESEERHRIVAEYTHGMECWISPNGVMLYVSPSCERITGHAREYFMGDSAGLERLVHAEDLGAWRQFHTLHLPGDDDSLDYRIRHKGGALRWVNEVKREVMGGNGGSLGVRISLRDITDRKEMELQLRHLALHDPLTGLANRTLCLDRVRQAMERGRRRQPYSFSLIFLDIDRFKVLNDSLGHAEGDKLLLRAAEVLRVAFRPEDVAARVGGDEFAVLLPGVDEAAARGVVERLRLRLEEHNQSYPDRPLRWSLGMATRRPGISIPQVLREADQRMYVDKSTRGTTVRNGS